MVIKWKPGRWLVCFVYSRIAKAFFFLFFASFEYLSPHIFELLFPSPSVVSFFSLYVSSLKGKKKSEEFIIRLLIQLAWQVPYCEFQVTSFVFCFLLLCPHVNRKLRNISDPPLLTSIDGVFAHYFPIDFLHFTHFYQIQRSKNAPYITL
jgi:hypothetical protein